MRRCLLAASFLLSIIAVAIPATGGFTTRVFELRVSAHSWEPSAIAASVAGIVWFLLARRANAVSADLLVVDGWVEQRVGWLISVVALLSGAVAVRFSTFSASGADPSGYLSEAAMLASAALERVEPLAALVTWRDAPTTLAPLGWQAAASGLQVPTYAVGLPLLMVIPHAAGGALGATFVVCVSAAVAVWCTGQLARRLAGGAAGVLAAAWAATMPILIYESIQPMSDVPVTGAWLACWLLVISDTRQVPGTDTRQVAGTDTRQFVAGFATGLAGVATLLAGIATAAAILIRPNLAPLAAMPLAFLLAQRTPSRQVVLFIAPIALAGGLIAFVHWRWFGSPLRSGYGTPSQIYSLTYVGQNLRLYSQWLLDTHGPLLFAAPLGLIARNRAPLRWLLWFALSVCGAYLIYGYFETWPYLRFLLPAMTIAAISVSVLVAALVSRLPRAARAPLLVAAMLAISGYQLTRARELYVFGLESRQRRAAVAGNYLASAVKPTAVLISGEQSGAMRYYTGRSIVRWDVVDGATLDEVRTQLTALGRDLWIVLDDWEVALFRDKFPDLILDWPPVLDAGTEGRIQAWRLADRSRFVTGGRVITERLR